MNAISPDRYRSIVTAEEAVFDDLRKTLANEVSSSALLSELLQRVNSMRAAQDSPEEFEERFDEFVLRADEHMAVIRPFCPLLVSFLPSRRPCLRRDLSALNN
jgi:hypothetical protein